jgi:hypothetical protein
MATNNRPLKAYVRYDGSGRAVSSSLIWRKNKPKVGNWKEVQGYECCNPGGGTFTTEIVFPASTEFPDQIFIGIGFVVICNSTPVISYFIEYPLGTNTTQEVVDYLNPLLSGVASFTVVNGTTISVSFSQVIADALCPSGTLTVEPSVPA